MHKAVTVFDLSKYISEIPVLTANTSCLVISHLAFIIDSHGKVLGHSCSHRHTCRVHLQNNVRGWLKVTLKMKKTINRIITFVLCKEGTAQAVPELTHKNYFLNVIRRIFLSAARQIFDFNLFEFSSKCQGICSSKTEISHDLTFTTFTQMYLTMNVSFGFHYF